MASSPAPAARVLRAWTRALTKLASKRLISSLIRSCLNPRRAIVSPARQHAYPDVPLPHLPPRVEIACYRRFHANRRLAPSRAAHQATDPRSTRLRLPWRVSASCTPDIRNAASAGPAQPYDASGCAWQGSLGPTRGCLDPGAVRSPCVHTAVRIDCLREPPRPAIELASPPRRRILSPQIHSARSSGPCVGSARKREG